MRRNITLVAHNIRSLWNVGSLFRSADAFGVSEIILAGYTPTPPREEISKTAIGAEAVVPWRKEEDLMKALKNLRMNGATILALETGKEAVPLQNLSFPIEKAICLVIGNEVLGVPKEALEFCDAVTAIPMLGTKESLNVSVAAGIALYALAIVCGR